MTPRVLIVDDSPYIRMSLSKSLGAHGFDVVGQARNGAEAVDMNLSLEPDVVLLDLQMPVMGGVEATRRMLQTREVPILVFASMDALGAELAIQALAEGAYDVIAKTSRTDITVDLAPHIWAIATREPKPAPRRQTTRPDVIVVLSSTGGPPCVQTLVSSLPADFPTPVVLAQHMPPGFTRRFAERLDSLSDANVFEAQEGSLIGPGDVAVLPGGHIGTIERRGHSRDFTVHIGSGEGLLGAKPSGSALFFSALGAARENVLAIVLTGMGADGSDAVRGLVSIGASVIAQDPNEAVIPSMPNAALHAGAQRQLRMSQIVNELHALQARPEAP